MPTSNDAPTSRTRKANLLRFLALLSTSLPFFLGPLALEFSLSGGVVAPLLERLFFFWIVCGLWFLTRRIMFRWFLGSQAAQGRSFPRILGLIGSALAFLLALQFLHFKIEDSVFPVVLFYLGATALHDAYKERRLLVRSLIAQFLAVTSVGYLSFLLLKPTFSWEPALLSAAPAVLMVGRTLLTQLPFQPERHLLLGARTALGLILLAPTLIASLCYLGKLGPEFVLVFGVIPFLSPLAESLRNPGSNGLNSLELEQRGDVLLVVFTAIFSAILLVRHV